jgi:hypothetical protein
MITWTSKAAKFNWDCLTEEICRGFAFVVAAYDFISVEAFGIIGADEPVSGCATLPAIDPILIILSLGAVHALSRLDKIEPYFFFKLLSLLI